MDSDRTAAAQTQASRSPTRRSQTHTRPRGADGDLVCAPQRHPVEHAAEGDGLRLREHVLAAARPLATGRRLETVTHGVANRAAPARRARCGAGDRRQCLPPRVARGKKTGPNPTDRRKAGSKHHVLTDAQGIPLVARLTAANRNDISELLDLVDAMPAIGGRPGPPCRKPIIVQGDRGYDSERHRDELRQRGITPRLAYRYRPHGSGLGRTRWVVERTLAWLHRFRRLNVRYERRPCVHEAFLTLACALVCWNHLKPVS